MRTIHPDDPLVLKELYWPDVRLYNRQHEIVWSSLTYPETYVTAGNKLGKDYVAGFLALSCFIIAEAKGITCRIVTTSVAEHHLKVLWGEIGRFWASSRQPLDVRKGGRFVMNYQEIRRAEEAESKNPLSYLVGRVSAKGEGLAGHHADWTMIIGDEASGLDRTVLEMAQGWARHMLWLGNPNTVPGSFFQEQIMKNLKDKSLGPKMNGAR